MAKILMMTKKQAASAALTVHGQKHKQCQGFCPWGGSGVKHGDDSGGRGRAAKRKARGLKKGWHKEWLRLVHGVR